MPIGTTCRRRRPWRTSGPPGLRPSTTSRPPPSRGESSNKQPCIGTRHTDSHAPPTVFTPDYVLPSVDDIERAVQAARKSQADDARTKARAVAAYSLRDGALEWRSALRYNSGQPIA
eukprot:Polyplicarium_translucidae@DN3189_c0_g2_i6.p4